MNVTIGKISLSSLTQTADKLRPQRRTAQPVSKQQSLSRSLSGDANGPVPTVTVSDSLSSLTVSLSHGHLRRHPSLTAAARLPNPRQPPLVTSFIWGIR